MKQYYVYIVSSNSNILYIWVTSDLVKRVYQHKNKLIEWFTSKYNINRLVYYEVFNNIGDAIKAEKKLKNRHRKWKEDLIKEFNPANEDLYFKII